MAEVIDEKTSPYVSWVADVVQIKPKTWGNLELREANFRRKIGKGAYTAFRRADHRPDAHFFGGF